MKKLTFKTTGEWNLQGSSKKRLYISLMTKVDDWKKSVIFYRSDVGKEVFDLLLQFADEEKPRVDWTFSIIEGGRYMNSVFASRILSISDETGKVVFAENNELDNQY